MPPHQNNKVLLNGNDWKYLTVCKQTSSVPFKNVTNKLFFHKSHTHTHTHTHIYIYIYIYIYAAGINLHVNAHKTKYMWFN